MQQTTPTTPLAQLSDALIDITARALLLASRPGGAISFGRLAASTSASLAATLTPSGR